MYVNVNFCLISLNAFDWIHFWCRGHFLNSISQMGFLLHSWVIFLVRFQYSYPSLLKLENVLEKSQQKPFSHVRTQNVLRSFIWNIIQTSSTRRAMHWVHVVHSSNLPGHKRYFHRAKFKLTSYFTLYKFNLLSKCSQRNSKFVKVNTKIQYMLNRARLSFHLEDPSLLTIFLHSALNNKPINTFISQ